MPINEKNLVRHELIGLVAEVIKSSNKQVEGMKGRVVDERRNTLTLEIGGREKVLPKEENSFLFLLPSGREVSVDGKVLVGRPEDRIKKKLRKW